MESNIESLSAKSVIRPRLPAGIGDLDDHLMLEVARVLRYLDSSDLPPDPAITDILFPARHVIERVDVELNFLCSTERWQAFDLTVDLLGMPAHSLVALRFGLTEEHWDQIKLSVERVPFRA